MTHTLPTYESEFWAKVAKGDGCWEWQAHVRPSGYGMFHPAQGFRRSAHRYAYELTSGPIPEGLIVCHSCDNRKCVRPDHLWLGTHADNARDRDRKGRNDDRNGERHPMSKLTEEQAVSVHVRANAGESVYVLADEFGLSHDYIYAIKNGRRWKRAIEAWRKRDVLTPFA